MTATDTGSDQLEAGTEADQKLQLDVKVDEKSACERHVVVTIPAAEVERYRRKVFDEIVPKAELPGFRQGKAPRKLVESRFRDQVDERVKSELVMDSLEQITEGGYFTAISEPDFDFDAIDLPEEGDFKYEFEIEVRPDFETPKWEGLKLTRPVVELTDELVDGRLKRSLSRLLEGEAVEGPVQLEDLVTLNVSFKRDGKEIGAVFDETVHVRPSLLFRDAEIPDFDQHIVGKKEGDVFTIPVKISDSAANEALRGEEVEAEFEVVEVRRISIE
ncbi:MAG: trigger factor, partial [Planctomycetota bacterium]